MTQHPVNNIVAADGATSNQTLYGSDRMAELLRGLGYEYAFINPGSSFRGLHDSIVNVLGNTAPELVLTTHEMIAVGMAHGYAKAKRQSALVILHNLVGLMNGSMAIYNAFCDQTPLLILGGSGPADPAERRFIDWAHSANAQGDLIRNYVKWTDEPPTLDAIIDGILLARKKGLTAPQGPSYLSIDAALQEVPIDSIDLPELSSRVINPPAAPHPSPAQLDELVELLVSSKMPLIFAGRLGLDPETTEPLKRLVELSGAAYHDDRNIVCFPTNHPQNLNGDKAIAKDADLLICFDCQDVNLLSGQYQPKRSNIAGGAAREDRATIVDVSMNAYFGNSWTRFGGPDARADLVVSADPLATIRALGDRLAERLTATPDRMEAIEARRQQLADRSAALREARQARYAKRWEDQHISLPRITGEVYEAIKAEDWTLVVRNHRSWQDGIFEFTGAGQYLGGDGGGGVGYGPAAAAGAALALKGTGKIPVAMLGDGDFVMASGALWSAAAHKAPLLLVILNNRTWGNDELHQREVAHQRNRPVENAHVGQRMEGPDIDLTNLARSYGVWSVGPISDPAELSKHLNEAVSIVRDGGIAVVEVLTALD